MTRSAASTKIVTVPSSSEAWTSPESTPDATLAPLDRRIGGPAAELQLELTEPRREYEAVEEGQAEQDDEDRRLGDHQAAVRCTVDRRQ